MDLAGLTVPGSVLDDVRYVASVAQDVTIHDDKLRAVADEVETRLLAGIDDVDTAFGSAGSLERDVNLVFFETACNFCFWSERSQDRWTVDAGGREVGGWYGLAACFDRAARAGMPVWDAAWMATLTVDVAREIFAGTGQPIPQIELRVDNIIEAATFLVREHHGHAVDLLRQNGFSAPRVTIAVVRGLPSLRDGAWYKGKWVWILKRAQILSGDLAQLNGRYPEFVMKDCDQLTVFADYRLPQVLRHRRAMEYSASLSAIVDTRTILASGSSKEVEIRACTIEACERLKKHLPGRTSADIDLGLWLTSQDLRTEPALLPHHRTPGNFY